MTQKNNEIRIIDVLVIIVLLVALVGWLQGHWSPGGVIPLPVPSPGPPNDLTMTAEEARLTRQAIELVREGVVSGALRTTELTREALSMRLPPAVRERVMRELGHPDMDFMRDALDVLDGKIVERM